MNPAIDALRRRYEQGELTDADFGREVAAVVATMPPGLSWWQRFQHWRHARRMKAEQQKWLWQRQKWQRERDAEAAHDAAIDAWSAVYRPLLALLSLDERVRNGFICDTLDWVHLCALMGGSKEDTRKMQLGQARSEVQKLVWLLERLDRLAPADAPIHTPEDVTARLMREGRR